MNLATGKLGALLLYSHLGECCRIPPDHSGPLAIALRLCCSIRSRSCVSLEQPPRHRVDRSAGRADHESDDRHRGDADDAAQRNRMPSRSDSDRPSNAVENAGNHCRRDRQSHRDRHDKRDDADARSPRRRQNGQ